MIDRTTFIIVIVKLIGLQIILLGVFFALLSNAPFYTVLICIGSLVFAVGSNILLAINIRAFRKLRNGGSHAKQNQDNIHHENSFDADSKHFA